MKDMIEELDNCINPFHMYLLYMQRMTRPEKKIERTKKKYSKIRLTID
jgi:hypothetical protein